MSADKIEEETKYASGKLATRITKHPNGSWTRQAWHENGYLSSEDRYDSDDTRHGVEHRWDTTGKVICAIKWRNNMRHGKCFEVVDGLLHQYTCEYGDLTGEYTIQDGAWLIHQCTYRGGDMNGLATSYFIDGTKCRQTFITDTQYGDEIYWDANGKVVCHVIYTNGVMRSRVMDVADASSGVLTIQPNIEKTVPSEDSIRTRRFCWDGSPFCIEQRWSSGVLVSLVNTVPVVHGDERVRVKHGTQINPEGKCLLDENKMQVQPAPEYYTLGRAITAGEYKSRIEATTVVVHTWSQLLPDLSRIVMGFADVLHQHGDVPQFY